VVDRVGGAEVDTVGEVVNKLVGLRIGATVGTFVADATNDGAAVNPQNSDVSLLCCLLKKRRPRRQLLL